MTAPKNLTSYPIVVFLHGSGPNDRDETIGPNKPFRDLAHGLAKHGIGSLRYDKRTFIYGKKSVPEGEEVTLDSEALNDAHNAISLAAKMEAAGCVYLLGHSLGATLAPRIANENQKVTGIILLAGNARPLEELIIEQYNYLFSQDGVSKKEEGMLNKLEGQINNLSFLKENPDATGLSLPLELTPTYWKSLIEYDQLEEIKTVEARILILQGERDYQVTMEDYELWRNALHNHENVHFKSYPKLNHLFLEGEEPSYPSEYLEVGKIPDYVINDIATWILNN